MENLPVELIQRICDHLCLHCQLPSSFAHADTWQVRESKDALANLSAASSWLRAIAQPVLFHYFATGKLILTHRQNNLPQPDSPLSLFIRSAIRRPDLAARVKALQLVQSSQFASDLDAVADCVGPYSTRFATVRAVTDAPNPTSSIPSTRGWTAPAARGR
jgi:hypothetical protein